MTEILKIEHLSVSLRGRRGERALIKDMSLAVRAGECLGILGESGGGKSLAMKAAMGLLDKHFAVRGSVRFLGRELVGMDTEALRRIRSADIGMILQNPMNCFDPLYRIGRQMEESLNACGTKGREVCRKISLDILGKMRIKNPEEVLMKYPHQLSGGMLQRIMIGLAAAKSPSLMVADEPTTAIDALTQFEIIEELVKLKRGRQMAMVFISHDLNAVSKIADSIIVLSRGEIVERGSFHDIMKHAKEPYTRLLVEQQTKVMRRYRAAVVGREVKHAELG